MKERKCDIILVYANKVFTKRPVIVNVPRYILITVHRQFIDYH